jgi:arginyl-tRNA synthetase
MLTPKQDIEAIVRAAWAGLLDASLLKGDWVKPCQDEQHGDYQVNVALAQAKIAGENPRPVAERLAAAVPENPVMTRPEIAGPGFLNFRLLPGYLTQQLQARLGDERLGVEKEAKPQTIVLDFSGPNIAKEMHVGHIRSTILGDALARLHRFLGFRVITDNHLGDWGTQFGMVILGYKRKGSVEALAADPFGHLEGLYKEIQEQSKSDETILPAARQELLKLQQGDGENRGLWQQFIDLSLAAIDEIYRRLGVKFDYTLGESFYNDRLPGVVAALLQQGLARESQGAVAVFSDGLLPPKQDPFLITDKEAANGFRDNPFLIQKSDGAYLYGTTDLATVEYRVQEWQADRAVYVTDARQQMHFNQLFATVRRWGLPIELEHVWFGSILGEDKKPLKTREGKPIKLKALLEEAEERAEQVIAARRKERVERAKKIAVEKGLNPDEAEAAGPDFSEEQKKKLAKVVGLGALKYADLAQNRNLDYVFQWEKMLAFDGNTAPYIQNAYVRIRSIFRKADLTEIAPKELIFTEPSEWALLKKLLMLGDAVAIAASEYRPHYLCLYLFEVAALYHRFNEACPVLKAEKAVRESRLALSAMTAETLRVGLDLLGIGVVEEM